MPQFDFTKFTPQIFWFSICFLILYFFISRVILPRIRNIIKDRKNVISADLSNSASLQDKINEVQSLSSRLRIAAGSEYQSIVESATKNAAKYREKALEELKEKVDIMVQKSNQEVKNFISESKAKNKSAIENLVKQIKEKILT
jgi:F-type H+-transporting ATPase subunit b